MLIIIQFCEGFPFAFPASITSGSTSPGVGSGELSNPELHFFVLSQWSCCIERGIGVSRKTQPGGQLEPALAKENKASKLRFFDSICVEVSRKENRMPGLSYPSLFHLAPPGICLLSGLSFSSHILFQNFVQLYPNYRLLKWCVSISPNSWKRELKITLLEAGKRGN